MGARDKDLDFNIQVYSSDSPFDPRGNYGVEHQVIPGAGDYHAQNETVPTASKEEIGECRNGLFGDVMPEAEFDIQVGASSLHLDVGSLLIGGAVILMAVFVFRKLS